MPSAAYISAVNARVNDDEMIALLAISHDDFDPVDWPPDGKIYVAAYKEAVVSGGITYTAWPFTWKRPDQRSDRLPQIPIEIDNVDPTIMREIVQLNSPPQVSVVTVMASSPDTIEEGPMDFDLQSATDDRRVIRARLGFEPMLWMAAGKLLFSPDKFPGLFR